MQICGLVYAEAYDPVQNIGGFLQDILIPFF